MIAIRNSNAIVLVVVLRFNPLITIHLSAKVWTIEINDAHKSVQLTFLKLTLIDPAAMVINESAHTVRLPSHFRSRLIQLMLELLRGSCISTFPSCTSDRNILFPFEVSVLLLNGFTVWAFFNCFKIEAVKFQPFFQSLFFSRFGNELLQPQMCLNFDLSWSRIKHYFFVVFSESFHDCVDNPQLKEIRCLSIILVLLKNDICSLLFEMFRSISIKIVIL